MACKSDELEFWNEVVNAEGKDIYWSRDGDPSHVLAFQIGERLGIAPKRVTKLTEKWFWKQSPDPKLEWLSLGNNCGNVLTLDGRTIFKGLGLIQVSKYNHDRVKISE